MNLVVLMGRLVADPELRYTSNNTPCCKFKIAVNRPGKQKEGQPTAEFFGITAWRNTAEFVAKYFKKGQQILIEGSLFNNNYEDKNGIKHYSNDVRASQVYFADSKRDLDNTGDGYNAVSQYQSQTIDLNGDDDLPFEQTPIR